MLKMVDGTGIIGVDMVCPLGGAVSTPQPPNYDNVEMEGVGSLTLPNSLIAPLERLELIGNNTQGENPAPDNPQEIESAGRFDEASGKYLLDVKVTGKNLLNLQKQPDVEKTYLGWKVSNGEKIALSIKDKGNNADITGCYLGLSRTGGSSDGVVWVVNNGSVAVKEVVSKNQYVSVFPPNETTVRKLLERFDIQVEEGTVATDYAPYTEQFAKIALDEPLRGIGEYKDVLTKDGVVRRIKQITVDEKSNLIFYMESKNTFGYLVKVPDATQTNYIHSVISDRFVKIQYIDSNDTNGVVTLFGKQIIFRVSKEIANSIDALKEWLANNNITFNYVLESPIKEPLPESVQDQLSALHSENGVTHVFVDSGEVLCGIKLTYRKEK